MVNYELSAGAGAAQIKFDEAMLPTEGFCAIHDLPSVRILCLECVGKAAIASVEVVMLDELCMEKCRKIIEKHTGVPGENIWIHVTHAISTPHTPGPKGPPHRRPEPSEEDRRKQALYYGAIERAFEEAARSAVQSFGKVKLCVGSAECFVNRNRDIETAYGFWIGLGEGPSNRELTVIRLNGEDGKAKALLLSYGIKPCVLDNSMMQEGKRQISADLCGEACRILEEQYEAPVLFCMSAAGDQVPREMVLLEQLGENGALEKLDYGVDKGFEIISRLGEEMAESARAAAESARLCEDIYPLEVSSAGFDWPTAARRKMKPSLCGSFVKEGETRVDVGLIRMGDIVFVSAKPEINYVTELQLHKASEAKTTLLISMVNGGMKYMPELSAYERNTWEAQSSMLLPGAAEKFVETAKKLINREGS